MDLFYVHPSDVQLPYLTLRDQEARHAGKVMRYRVGDTVYATDGKGYLFKTKLIENRRQEILLELLDKKFEEPPEIKMTLCLGIIKKKDRLEFAVEKAVELGVHKIVVFKGEHSQKEKVREGRLAMSALAAMKQSLRVYLPQILIFSSLERVYEEFGNECTIVLADETSKNEKLHIEETENLLLVIGPEGGFSQNEKNLRERWKPLIYSLGEKRLRSETAAIVMVDRFRNMK